MAEEKAKKRKAESQPRGRKKRKTNEGPSTEDNTGSGSKLVENNTISSDDSCECCECGVTYEEDILSDNGEEWVRCGCGNWIHEKCILEVKVGDNGKELFCPVCMCSL